MKQKVLVVTHDAGGSEIIGAYVRKNRATKEFRVFTNGPGARVFRRLGVPFSRIRDDRGAIKKVVERNTDCNLALLALPGWMTRIELTALEESKRAGIRTVVYLEDWTAYRERLGHTVRDWRYLPDELWAGDKAALRIARKEFARLPVSIKLVPNEYFRSVTARYRALRKKYTTRSILFLSSAWGTSAVFSDLLKLLSANNINAPVRIRFHPADDRTRYDHLIRRHRGSITIEKSKEKDVTEDLARARIVVGNRTVALVLSALCGLPTVDIAARSRPPRHTSHQRWTIRPAPRLTFLGVRNAKTVRNILPLIRRAFGISARQRTLKRV